MQPDHLQALQKVLAGFSNLTENGDWQIQPVGGGSINSAFKVTTKDNRQWFCKFNNAAKFPDLFVTESRGLALISAHDILRTPVVLACTEVVSAGIASAEADAAAKAATQILVLEWIDQGLRSDAFWKQFGEQLARLHRITRPDFGLDHDNYMGALPQVNTPAPIWTDFFRDRRLQPQVHLAHTNGLLSAEACRQFDRLFLRLPDFFPPEPPALLHGDLWSGNFLCDTAGQPVLIDPAVYFGHRSVDLAMTTLFGGFDPAFYQAYNWHYPLLPGYREQWEIANLYPLLIHLNLFGAGYTENILHTIQRF